VRLRRRGRAAIPFPARADAVTVSVPGGDTMPARVLECDPESALTVAILVPTRPFGQRELDGLVVEYGSSRGRVHLTGSTVGVSPAEPDVVAFTAPLSVEIIQERDFVRVSSARPVLVYMGNSREKIQSFTVDLSGGGLLLAGPDTLQIGERVEFRLSVSQDVPPITGAGRVVRIDSKGRRGVSFTDISDGDRRRLVRYIFDVQRAERRRGLRAEGSNG